MADLPNVPRHLRNVAEFGLNEARDGAISVAKEQAYADARARIPAAIVDDDTLRTVLDDNIDRQLHQDRPARSKRTWAAISSAAAAALLLPEIQGPLQHLLTPAIGEAAPLVLATASAILASWSKRSDKRPMRAKEDS